MSAVPVDDDGLEIPEELHSSFAVLRRGIRESPELRAGLGFTVIISLGVVIAHLTTPIVIQLVFDNGFDGGFRPVYVGTVCAAAFGLVALTFVSSRAAGKRLVRAAEGGVQVR